MSMRSSSRLLAVGIACLLGVMPGWAQQQPASTTATTAGTSQQELDQLLAPIALYPDSLLAQILMASTYPLEIVMAARWSTEHPGVQGKALEDAMQQQTWDPSVKALTAVPKVLQQMNDNLGWMHKLGDAFLSDQKRVLDTVQTLRGKAQAAGNLNSTPQQTVRTEVQESKTVYIIEPAQPETVYVPTYDPYYAYGPWWYSYPPYYMYPPGYYYAPGVAFAAGIFVGAAIWGGCNWGGGGVYIDHHRYNNFNRTNIGNGNWNHRVDHRRGVAYGDNKVAQRYNRAGDARTVQSREQFRARADSGRASPQGMDRAQSQGPFGDTNRAQSQGFFGDANRASAGTTNRASAGTTNRASAGTADRASAGNRASSSNVGSARTGASVSTRDYGSRSGGGFSGAGSGSSTRQASSRGSASRGSMSGGGGRGGGGGGRR
jgi:uncharacterized protein DUF3300